MYLLAFFILSLVGQSPVLGSSTVATGPVYSHTNIGSVATVTGLGGYVTNICFDEVPTPDELNLALFNRSGCSTISLLYCAKQTSVSGPVDVDIHQAADYAWLNVTFYLGNVPYEYTSPFFGNSFPDTRLLSYSTRLVEGQVSYEEISGIKSTFYSIGLATYRVDHYYEIQTGLLSLRDIPFFQCVPSESLGIVTVRVRPCMKIIWPPDGTVLDKACASYVIDEDYETTENPGCNDADDCFQVPEIKAGTTVSMRFSRSTSTDLTLQFVTGEPYPVQGRSPLSAFQNATLPEPLHPKKVLSR